MRINKNIIISIGFITFLISALIYNLLYINNKKNEIIQEIESEDFVNEFEEIKEKLIYVHIDGEVNNPGLYELPEGSRINDAVIIAGGIKDSADLSDVNLAYVLSDAMKITIPKKEEEIKKTVVSTGISSNKKYSSNLININTATKDILKTLTGIGEATAEKIIEYREKNGSFKNIEELKNVSGIGEAKYSKIKEKIII